VSDGGTYCEIQYLIDYLETLVKKGEKPIIEAWFISHSHTDHCGALRAIAEYPECANRIYVEGIYYNEPGDTFINLEPAVRAEVFLMKEAAEVLRTTKGEAVPIYRPQMGQRYYFSDITVDIVMSQELLSAELCSGDINDGSTWCMFTIEGQKCLLGGDGDIGGMENIMAAYAEGFLDVDVFSLLHHGHNTRNNFTDFCKIQTVLVTRRSEPDVRIEENQYLKGKVKEWLLMGEGTRILTFPYQAGESECLPHKEWIYHKDKERPRG